MLKTGLVSGFVGCSAAIAFCCLLLSSCTPMGSDQYKYGLEPQWKLEEYEIAVRKDSNQELVDLQKEIPDAKFDIRYASSNNFVNVPVYNSPRAFARKPVAIALKKAQEIFRKQGYGLIVFDAYRPYSVTVKFYELYKDTTYVASPYHGSRHNRGAAVDISLWDFRTQSPLNMGTEYDDFTEKAHPDYQQLSDDVLTNRGYLISVMDSCGFDVYPSEWWHFDFRGWEQYPILDIPFEKLESTRSR